jgi:hypothetical protein
MQVPGYHRFGVTFAPHSAYLPMACFARYMAASDFRSKASAVTPSLGYVATPMLTPSAKLCAAMTMG